MSSDVITAPGYEYTPAEVMQMLIWFAEPANGCGPKEWVSIVFSETRPEYIAEKVRVAERGFIQFYAALDPENRAYLLDAMILKYGACMMKRRAQ